MKKLIQILLIALIVVSCSTRDNNKVNSNAVEMSKQGAEQMNKIDQHSAMVLFKKAIEIEMNYYPPYSNMIGIYIRSGKYENALTVIETAVKTRPDYAQGWQFSGLIRTFLGEEAEAKLAYEKTVEIYDKKIKQTTEAKELAKYQINRAVSLIMLDKKKEAKKALKKINEEYADPNLINVIINMSKQEIIDILFTITEKS